MLVPLKKLIDNPEQYGFKRCKKPYYTIWYRCFAKGCKVIFLSKYMIDIYDWIDSDPQIQSRIHSRPNCLYRDIRTADDYMCELIKLGVVDTHYSMAAAYEKIEEAEEIIKRMNKNDT
ncbi:MAG: hypothetical protein IKL53_10245 [Lachnospiraceae bacterium]|nr:hypothetical protein [Lachnospiraceae bacterium]